MKDRFRGRRVIAPVAVAAVFMSFAGIALANNLDRKTAQNAARQVAKIDCRNTQGCEAFKAVGLHKVSRHKAVGKIVVISHKNGERFACTRQVVIKLDHFNGDINYAVSKRRCKSLGPQ